jgi:hypothetical protein
MGPDHHDAGAAAGRRATGNGFSRRPDLPRRAAELVGLTRGRSIVVAIVAAYFVLLAGLGGHSEWNRLGVPPVSPAFADLRSVTSGWECAREGIPVLARNPCDPFGERPANYPRIWMWPAGLGLGQESTIALGLLVACAFFAAALAVLPRDATTGDAIPFGLAVCSPAVMLGVERGNVDLALFALVVLGVLLLRAGAVARVAGHASILLAAILKLFPIFAAVAFARQPQRRAVVGGAGVVALFGLYAVATIEDIQLIAQVVPQGNNLSFGMRRLTEPLLPRLDSASPWLSGAVHERLTPLGLDLSVAALVVAAAILVRVAAPGLLPRSDEERDAQRDLDLFWAGAGVYVFSYALFRSWDYRLVFVLLTLPQVLRWLRQGRRTGLLAVLALVGVLWFDAQPYWLPVAEARRFFLPAATAAQLLLFVVYVAALVGTSPRLLPARRAPGQAAVRGGRAPASRASGDGA